MKMKRTLYFPFLIVAALLLHSCTAKVDEVFDESASVRIEKELVRIREILPEVPNGWLMEYFPGASQSYGGYNVLLSFTHDMDVTAMSEATGKGVKATSKFALKQSSGPVLSFDIYNEVLHYFADPDDPAGAGGPGFGLGGDFEFLVLSASEEEIVLKGRKTGSVAVMTPMSPAMEWGDYLDDIAAKAREISNFYRLKYTGEDEEVFEGRLNKHNLEVFKYDGEGARYSEYYPFIVTLTGCRFYSPVVLGNEEVEGLVYIADMGDDGAFVPTNEATGMFVPSYPSFNEFVMTKNWFLKASSFSPSGKALWDKAKAKMDADGTRILYCYLGMNNTILGDNYSFIFMTEKEGNGFLSFDYDLVGQDGISLQFSEVGTVLGKDFYVNYGFNGVITPFGNDKKRTFKLTADDIKNPSWIKFTDVDDPDNWFTAYRSMIYYPFEN